MFFLSQRALRKREKLAVVSRISEVLARSLGPEAALREILARCTETGDISLGAVYSRSPDGRLGVQAHVGDGGAAERGLEAFFGHPELLHQLVEARTPAVIPSDAVSPKAARAWLSRARMASALVVPLTPWGGQPGALLLGSSTQQLAAEAWILLGRSVASQVGQAMALAKANSESKASEQRYRGLLDHANDAICVLDANGMILEVNGQLETLLGMTRDRMTGRALWDLVVPHERSASRAALEHALSAGSVRDRQHLQRANGELVEVELSGPVVGAESERVVLAIAHDLTERRRAQESPGRSEERFRGVVETALDGIVLADTRGRVAYVNNAAARMFGYETPERVSGMPLTGLIPDRYREIHLRGLGRYRSTGKGRVMGQTLEVHGLKKDGSEFPAELTIAESARGSLAAIIRDATDRKRAEAAHLQAEARYHSLVENAVYGIYRSTLSGRFTQVNPALVDILGYDSKEELMAVDMAVLYGDPNEHRRVIRDFRRRGMVSGIEVDWRRKNGTSTRVRLKGRLVRDDDEEQGECYEVFVEDVSERRRLEEQFWGAQKMEAVGRLAGGVAHDFNNVLSAIIGSADLLEKKLGPDHPLGRHARHIQRAGNQAADLTRQLLALGRRQIIRPMVLSLNSVIEGNAVLLRRLIGEHVDLRTRAEPRLGHAKADPTQIGQVIVNLAVNARDAMPKGGVLTIETANVELDAEYARTHTGVEPGPHVMLAVTDTGTGMDQDTQAHMFDPFFTTKEEEHGTGLGLSTVYGIVRQNRGSIWVYSEVGRGTTVKIYLPRVGEPLDQEETVSRRSLAPGGSETLLVVEDDAAAREVLVEVLRDLGYAVLEAGSPQEALAHCQSHESPIHLLLTDVVLPRMSGMELAKRVASLRSETKTVFMSGYTENGVVDQGELRAGVPFLQKPFDAAVLAGRLRDVLDAAGRPGSPPDRPAEP